VGARRAVGQRQVHPPPASSRPRTPDGCKIELCRPSAPQRACARARSAWPSGPEPARSPDRLQRTLPCPCSSPVGEAASPIGRRQTFWSASTSGTPRSSCPDELSFCPGPAAALARCPRLSTALILADEPTVHHDQGGGPPAPSMPLPPSVGLAGSALFLATHDPAVAAPTAGALVVDGGNLRLLVPKLVSGLVRSGALTPAADVVRPCCCSPFLSSHLSVPLHLHHFALMPLQGSACFPPSTCIHNSQAPFIYTPLPY